MSPAGRKRGDNVTIVDVAQKAGVSVSTVSRVVRNHPDVKSVTRERVLAAVRLLDYRPSTIARALVAGRSQSIGLLVSDIVNPFYPQLARSIEIAARQQGCAVIMCNTDDREDETERYVGRLLDDGVQGVIHASVGSDERRTLEQLGDSVSIVFTNRRPRNRECSYVVADNYAGATKLTQHLVELGHRRIGFITGPTFAANGSERLSGFLDAAREAGVETILAEGEFTFESGAQAAMRWLNTSRQPTAIVGVNDLVALGAFDALVRLGRRVPEDVAVAGFDDILLAGTGLVGLTSVSQHIDEMGRRAVNMLMQLTSRPPEDRTPLQEVVETEVLVRPSTVGGSPARPSSIDDEPEEVDQI